MGKLNIAVSKVMYGLGKPIPRNLRNYLFSVRARTLATIMGGDMVAFPNAARHLKHFYDNTGQTLFINVTNLIYDDTTSRTHYYNELNDAMRWVERLWSSSDKIVSTDNAFTVAGGGSVLSDWHMALGRYDTYGIAEEMNCKYGQYKMTWTMNVRDFYDWDIGESGGGGLVFDKEMAVMHYFGLMRDYEINGWIKVTAKWKYEQTSRQAEVKIIGTSY